MIGLALARRLARAALDEADRRGLNNISVVVTDPGGGVTLALRSDAQGAFGFETARAKAATALGFGASTARLAAVFGSQPGATAAIGAAVGGRFMPIAGAVVVTDGSGRTLGAASISGGNPQADDEIVRMAVASTGLHALD